MARIPIGSALRFEALKAFKDLDDEQQEGYLKQFIQRQAVKGYHDAKSIYDVDTDEPDFIEFITDILMGDRENIFASQTKPSFNFNVINGIMIGGGLISGLSAMYSPISLWPKSLKPVGLIIGLGTAAVGVADALGYISIS